MAYLTSGVYGSNFSTYTRDGKKYYRVTGYDLGKQVYRESATVFHGSSTNPTETIGWCNYISESAYNGLSDVMKEAFDTSTHEVAKDGALTKIPSGSPGYFKFGLQTDMVYKPALDPCEGVICEDVCDDTDLYGTVCEGGICVRGRLIEEDSQICGYIPPEPEPPEPEPPEPIPWDMIILAGVGLILLYWLAMRS